MHTPPPTSIPEQTLPNCIELSFKKDPETRADMARVLEQLDALSEKFREDQYKAWIRITGGRY